MAWFKRKKPQPAPRPQALFDDAFLKKLEYLFIVARKVFAGKNRAERRSKKIGSGLEFADHRNYSPGDDFRYIDWHYYGRMDKLILRLYEEEEDLTIYLLPDISLSMALGEPPTKLSYALQISAALAYIGLCNLDRVGIIPFADGLKDRLAPFRGKGGIYNVFNFLSNLEPEGITDITSSLRSFIHQNKRRGLAVLITDFYDPQGYREGINLLRYNRFEPFIIHLFDERELAPDIRGDLRLIDCETGAQREITITKRILDQYQLAFKEYCREIEEFCISYQLSYFRVPIQLPFDELMLKIFRAGGFLK